jgi:ABC-2 type transport system permease protein
VNLWKLEWLRLVRTRRLVALLGVYAFFGFVGPLTARYLPEIIDRFGGEGFQVIVPDPVASDGIAQFMSSATQIGLLVAVVVAAGALTLDALPEMSVFLRTRVASPARLVVPRFTVGFAAASVAYFLGLGIAWYETAVLIGGLPAGRLLLGAVLGVLYLAFAVGVTAAVASRFASVLTTVLVSLMALLILPIAGIVDVVGRWLPSHLVGAQVDLLKDGAAADYLGAALVTVAATAAALGLAVRRTGTREL